jgi:hypothetical protein
MDDKGFAPRPNPERRGVAEGSEGYGMQPDPVATPGGDGQRAPSPSQFRPKFYHRDGKPVVFDQLGIPEEVQWAELFEVQDRTVRQTITPYGEQLSTVFLGLDHNFFGPPHIFETMLFAPHKNRRGFLSEDLRDRMDYEAESKRIEKRFPHDQLQHRYSTEAEALADHKRLARQCLIPPRLRRFVFYAILGDATWS